MKGLIVGRFRHFVSVVCYENGTMLSGDKSRTIKSVDINLTFVCHRLCTHYAAPSSLCRVLSVSSGK